MRAKLQGTPLRVMRKPFLESLSAVIFPGCEQLSAWFMPSISAFDIVAGQIEFVNSNSNKKAGGNTYLALGLIV
jgi:hypothetical protein